MALTDYVIMPGSDYQAICDSVRSKTGGTEQLKSGDVATAIHGIKAGGATGPVKMCHVRYSEGFISPYFVEGMTWAELCDSSHNAAYMTAAFVDAIYQPVFAVTENGEIKIVPTDEIVSEELPGLGTVGNPVKATDLIVSEATYLGNV